MHKKKKENNWLRLILLSLLTMVCSITYADIEVDGLHFSIIGNGQVELINCDYGSERNYYSGNIQIPETITFNDVLYHVTGIGDYAFAWSRDLTSVNIPSSVLTIGKHAFYECSSLTSVNIPSSVSTIGEYAFCYCWSLTGTLTLPNSLTSIEDYVFGGCSFTGPLNIPNTVTYIGKNAFAGCSGLTGDLTIPNSVTSIGHSAFQGCTGFTGTLTLPNSIKTISSEAFRYCKGLSGSLIIPNSVNKIEWAAFAECSGFTGDLNIPNSVTFISEGAFSDCSGFTGSLTIPNSLTSIEDYVFARCSGFSGKLIIPNSITTIGMGAFKGCNGFSGELIIPNSVTSIGGEAFLSCTGITSLIIPNSVSIIDNNAFKSCSSLELVYSQIQNPFSIELMTFGYISPNAILHIPKGTKQSYNQFEGWTCNFSKVLEEGEEDITTYTLTISATGNGSASYGGETIRETSKSYTLNEGTSATITFTPDNGYHIKSLKVNNAAVTVSTSCTVTVDANTTVAVEFEAIPPTTYTLSITASGNGSASYGGETIRGATKTYTVNEGTSATITFTPDNGYRIKSLVVNNAAVTASTSYTVTVNANTTVAVEFEPIPPTTYTLSITASGNGSASYSGETIRGTTKTYTVNEGTSATISFTPDNGYRIKSLVVNNVAVTASTSYTVTVNANTTVSVEFEAIPPTTYTLSIKATGNGSASYDGTAIRGTTKSFTVNEGTKATITFTPDDGYQIKSLKVNNAAVTASTSYTATINSDTSVEVEFEAKPVDPDIPKTYTLSIRAKGNGIATYNGETIRATTKTYTLEEGTKVSMTFTPDEGNQIKSLRVNGEYQTITDKYEGTINADTSIKIDFEEIPVDPEPQTTYTMTIKATGNGIATYNGETIRGEEKTYTLEEGTKVSMTFTPDEGNQIKSLKVNGEYQTVSDKYEATITSDTSIAVEFEEKPVEPEPQTTYTLTIKAVGNGIVSYGEEVIRDETSTFTLDEGTTGTISFTPDESYHIKSLSVNGSSIDIDTSYSFTMTSDISVEVVFEVTIVDRDITIDGLNYEVISFEEHTMFLRAGDYGLTLVVPDKVTYQDEEWSVTGIKEDALDKCEDLAAIIWNPETPFKASVSNPNLLLYVKHDSYAPANIKNVVVNGYARAITLTDAQSGNNFYCPEAFIAQSIVYMHNYSMKTGLNESRGWESIALPFDVQMISHSNKGEITSFANWTSESSTKPFWLYELTGSGFVETESIKANTPYIISMPNNGIYPNDYMLAGRVSFSAINAEVKKSDEVQTATFSNHTFIPSFINHDAEATYYALNVNNDYENYEGSENEGSKFILGLRKIHPFEAYMISTSGTRSIDISEGMTTGIRGIEEIGSLDKAIKVYDLSGRLIKLGATMDTIRLELPSGVYIINNKKMIIK